MLVFDSKINVHRIQELITSRVIPLYPRLTHKICPLPFMAGTVQCWLPDNNYDINQHVFTDHVNLSNGQLQVREINLLFFLNAQNSLISSAKGKSIRRLIPKQFNINLKLTWFTG